MLLLAIFQVQWTWTQTRYKMSILLKEKCLSSKAGHSKNNNNNNNKNPAPTSNSQGVMISVQIWTNHDGSNHKHRKNVLRSCVKYWFKLTNDLLIFPAITGTLQHTRQAAMGFTPNLILPWTPVIGTCTFAHTVSKMGNRWQHSCHTCCENQ